MDLGIAQLHISVWSRNWEPSNKIYGLGDYTFLYVTSEVLHNDKPSQSQSRFVVTSCHYWLCWYHFIANFNP